MLVANWVNRPTVAVQRLLLATPRTTPIHAIEVQRNGVLFHNK